MGQVCGMSCTYCNQEDFWRGITCGTTQAASCVRRAVVRGRSFDRENRRTMAAVKAYAEAHAAGS
jgi:hypothetical protein